MDENKNPENPNAFPHGYGTDKYERSEQGMTLRDYFAAKAMQAIISQEGTPEFFNPSKESLIQKDAERAYNMADAMLKQREL